MTGTSIVHDGPLTATIRECYVKASNLKQSAPDPAWTDEPTIYTIVIEEVVVDEPFRHQGHFKRFLAAVCADDRFEMVIVEGVQNEHLVRYLLAEGWDNDPEVMDFYRKRGKETAP